MLVLMLMLVLVLMKMVYAVCSFMGFRFSPTSSCPSLSHSCNTCTVCLAYMRVVPSLPCHALPSIDHRITATVPNGSPVGSQACVS